MTTNTNPQITPAAVEADEAALADYSYDAYWNDVEQGRYDDDPSPYDGNYSEM